ncbi:TetR/AcrR family transcriptional regulator [Aureibacter tunicatorum]|uniref:AcrR family transcriptional regulator n=1 Tax=Aureibacter tunicatorum TaxID=866807 RepID=A0AAE3XQF2_9BACT|nr:TetR/AcrR family transcriptional regulator [Aureibacter tunicatorum]MDR6240725.1 AcrR family transcriptional regulator [Aureibacter tunicatorum]BDD06942.1 hypothetical protein AUTU_44250 [Aureibacter tunicatorum]
MELSETKSKIIETAIKLYHQNGINNVSIEEIALASEISKGNFTYHYATKSELIDAILSSYCFELISVFDNIDSNAIDLKYYKFVIDSICELQKKYEFLLYNIFQILQESKRGNDIFNNTIKKLYPFGFKILNELNKAGDIRSCDSKEEMKSLIDQYVILTNYGIHMFSSDQNPLEMHQQTMASIITPYLTKEGDKKYKNFYC